MTDRTYTDRHDSTSTMDTSNISNSITMLASDNGAVMHHFLKVLARQYHHRVMGNAGVAFKSECRCGK